MPREPEAYIADDLFELGIGEVIVCRFKSDGRVEAGVFLVDVLCLGVKNAFYHVFEGEEEFREEILGPRLSATPSHPGSRGRKLVEDAARYAESLGISPHSDYKKAARVFGGIKAADCDEKFVFGRQGRPVLVQGPDDDPKKIDRICATLQVRLGEDGFDFEAADEDGEEFDGTIIAIDSLAGDEEPSPELKTFAEEFLEEHSEDFDDVIYGKSDDAPVAATFLSCAREMHAAADNGDAAIPFDMTLAYLQSVWNLRNFSEEERAIALEQFPEDVRAAMESEVESFPGAEIPIMILALRHLHPGEPSRERLLMLCEPL